MLKFDNSDADVDCRLIDAVADLPGTFTYKGETVEVVITGTEFTGGTLHVCGWSTDENHDYEVHDDSEYVTFPIDDDLVIEVF